MNELPEKVRVAIFRFSYDGKERVEIGSWVAQTACVLNAHPRIAEVGWLCPIGYPITAQRNAALRLAKAQGFHFAVFCDTDMIFDAHCAERTVGYDVLPIIPGQVPFLPAALDFALEHPGPCVIAAPYCAGPPNCRVLVHNFHERDPQNPNQPTRGLVLESISREEAARKTGIEMVAALPTGLMLIDTRVTDVMGPPWFRYEFTDATQCKLASTEDTTFSRDLFYLGVPQYVAWQSWACHVKDTFVGAPEFYPSNAYPLGVHKQWEEEVLARAKNCRPADRVNEVAQQILRERAARYRASEDAAPVVPVDVE